MWWFIFATGPSFRRTDAELFRGLGKSIAVNNAVFYAPWSDCLYACDLKWWQYYSDGLSWYKGERWSHQHYKENRSFTGDCQFASFGGNSGHQALQMAAVKGAKKICLLGFDQQFTGGIKHCHDDHPDRLGNAPQIDHYPGYMEKTGRDLKRMGVEVVNCTRETALTMFPRMTPEQFISENIISR